MRESRTSGLMGGEWKRNAWQDIQAPATERAGDRYGLSYASPRHSSTPQMVGLVRPGEPHQQLGFLLLVAARAERRCATRTFSFR
jgi:hypothetical protein